MSEALPKTVVVRESDGAVRYTLPRRSMGFIAVVPLIVGGGILGSGAYTWTVQPPLESWLFAAFSVGFPVFGSIALLLGLNWVLGRAVVEVDAVRLRASSRILGVGWWRTFPLKEGPRVEAGRIVVEGGDPRDPIGDLSVIVGPRRRAVATWYPLGLLRPLAADVNRRLAQRSPMQ